jgi:hypothetical protein
VTVRGGAGAVGDDTPGVKIGTGEVTCVDVADVARGAPDQVAKGRGGPYG